MKRLKIVTFWIGVNVIGLPNLYYHLIQRKKVKNHKEVLIVKGKQL